MQFTPLMAHRYLQQQINDLCYAFKQEKNMSESFRDEFASIQTFKFFTRDALSDLEANMKQYQRDNEYLRD